MRGYTRHSPAARRDSRTRTGPGIGRSAACQLATVRRGQSMRLASSDTDTPSRAAAKRTMEFWSVFCWTVCIYQ